MGKQVDPQDLGRQQRQGKPNERPDQHDGDLGQPARQAVQQEPPDVPVDASPFLSGLDDRAEFVVGQDQVGRLAGNLRSPLAHRHPDVSAAQRGTVVHSVARHGHHVTGRLPCADDVELLLRRCPGEDLGTCGDLGCAAVDHVAVRCDDADLRGDGPGRGRVIAGDEDRRYASCPAGGDGRGRSLPGRIQNAN
jgi:hypothetical protein